MIVLDLFMLHSIEEKQKSVKYEIKFVNRQSEPWHVKYNEIAWLYTIQ